ncbi:MAG: hypothetical protein ABIR32_02595 [Ilumatobacteraceae bacterium]
MTPTSQAAVTPSSTLLTESPTTTPPTASPITSPTPPASTAPAGPPMFDPKLVGSNLTLANFIVTVTVGNTNDGHLNESVATSGYISDPLATFELATYSYDGAADSARSFFIGERAYEETLTGDWYLDQTTNPPSVDRLDLRSGIVGGVLTADFDGEAVIAGIPADHFVFDETDLAVFSSYSPEKPSPAVEGDFYLARDGNFVVAAHSKETSANHMYEVTEALSSIGELAAIALPDDLVPMDEVLDLGIELGGLLPPDSTLTTFTRYENGIGIDLYTYRTSVRSNEDFLSFFRSLPPTNGWTVTHIGHIGTHLQPVNCETAIDCVILTKGGEQIVVSYRGGINLEYDHEHVFSAA